MNDTATARHGGRRDRRRDAGNVDLDAIPADDSSWTSVTVTTTFNTSSGDDALPASHGDPRFFHFSASVTIDVSYS